MITAPLTDEPDLGGFAQTRPPDDLFGDDFTPLAEPIIESAAPSLPSVHAVPPSQIPKHASRKHANQVAPKQSPQYPTKATTKFPNDGVTTPAPPASAEPVQSPKSQIPSGAVRGDRSATGGAAKPKMTEDELNAKMEAIKLKNVALEEAHARSKADEASFQASEAAVKEKQRQDRANRQAMLSEREKNAQRKMQAQGGRDWDATKEESDVVDRPHRKPLRGAYGGVAGGLPTARISEHHDTEDVEMVGQPGMRGGFRGGRGRSRGRGGRGGRGNTGLSSDNGQGHSVPTAQDFPALNETTTATQSSKTTGARGGQIDTTVSDIRPAPNRVDSLGAVVTPGEKKSWAEQMDDSTTNWKADAVEQNAPKGGW